jgi:hypothetical protein
MKCHSTTIVLLLLFIEIKIVLVFINESLFETKRLDILTYTVLHEEYI